jgi:hypothetical protein
MLDSLGTEARADRFPLSSTEEQKSALWLLARTVWHGAPLQAAWNFGELFPVEKQLPHDFKWVELVHLMLFRHCIFHGKLPATVRLDSCEVRLADVAVVEHKPGVS